MMRTKILIPLLLFGLVALAMPVASHAQVSVGISIRVGPPPLPVYVQPVCPEPGYLWTPGYWAYGDDGYYWVPGTWVEPPMVGVLWTPGYWGWRNGFYVWNGGYWGPHVGFYGGINYGFGYTGVGFAGGYWRGGVYNYNRSVTNVNVVNIHNTYNTTVINNNTTVNRVSFNGGAGGTTVQATAAERHAAQERHFQATSVQTQHEHLASSNRALLASTNHGQPTIAASPRPGVFHGQGVVAANTNGAVNKNGNYQKFNGNNSQSGGNKLNSANTSGNQGNGPRNRLNGNNSASNPNLTYHTTANATQNNAHVNNTHVNNMNTMRVNNPPVNNTHVNNAHGGQNGGQQSHGNASHPDKHDKH